MDENREDFVNHDVTTKRGSLSGHSVPSVRGFAVPITLAVARAAVGRGPLPPRAMGGDSPTSQEDTEEEEPVSEGAATISKLLAMQVTPTAELASVAARAGLGDFVTRAIAWPKLLALDMTRADTSAGLFQGRATALNQRERNQVELDVRRSHWMPPSRDAGANELLSRVIRGVLASHPGECRYYQGLHDIAAVLVLVCGESASAVLDRLVVGHLRDAVRGNGLDQVLKTLQLLPHLIAVADPELHAAVFPQTSRSAFGSLKNASSVSGASPDEETKTSDTASSDDSDDFVLLTVADFTDMDTVGTCHFAVPWFLTWFAHSLNDLQKVSRLFDVFLSNDPLMPLYVGAAAIVADRTALLAMARGETDEQGNIVNRNGSGGDASGTSRGRGLHRANDWPIVEGMLHTRLSTLPALVGNRSSSGGGVPTSRSTENNQWVRAVLRVVELAGADGGFRSAITVALSVDGETTTTPSTSDTEKNTSEWGVEAVIKSALLLHKRLPPRSMFTVIGTEPDPFSAYAAYPYPWLAMNRWGFDSEKRVSGDAERANDHAAATGSAEDVVADPTRPSTSFRLGQGASASSLFAQRLGANIRRGVTRASTELQKQSDRVSGHDSGLGNALAGLLSGSRHGTGGGDVPRLNDDP